MAHWFAHPGLLTGLAAIVLLGLVGLWSGRQSRQARQRLGPRARQMVTTSEQGFHRFLGMVSLVAGLLLLCLGAAGPQWGKDWDQTGAPGRDLLVVVDCSRSMLAESPTRLERARAALVDLVDTLQKQGGHRIGLVAFAGRPRLVCPLTHDYDHFRSTLDSLESLPLAPDLAPGLTEASGTRIGLALSEAVRAHDPRYVGRRDIFLVSDGDDPANDGEYTRGIDDALVESIPVHTFGFGNPDEPSPIRIQGKPLTSQGTPVLSRLQEAPLRDIARQTHGIYTPVWQRNLPMGEFYLELIAGLEERDQSDDSLPVYRQQYALFLLPAFTLLYGLLWWPERLGGK